jgi:hypothetical protein
MGRRILVQVSPSEFSQNKDLLNLPGDFLAFRRAGETFPALKPKECECGFVKLKLLNELVVESVPVAIKPHDDSLGFFSMDIVNLVAQCEKYEPFGTLIWLPNRTAFAQYDSDHAVCIEFPSSNWEDIVEAPAVFLSAQWNTEIGEVLYWCEKRQRHIKWRYLQPM